MVVNNHYYVSIPLQTPSVDSYSIGDIESDCHLSRDHMIAVGLLIGCDYAPKGVPGVGKTQVIKLCAELSSDKILKRYVFALVLMMSLILKVQLVGTR